jgi:membrane fusion protein (multidrug efflux system)
MVTRNRLAIGGGVLALFALVVLLRLTQGTGQQGGTRQQATLVKVEHPTVGSVARTLEFTGDVLPVQQAAIFSKVTGNLEKVYVDMGTRVRKGQTLALIDTTELHLQCQQAAATHQNALLVYGRTKDLFEQNLIAKQDLDNAEANLKVASAAWETATTRLGYATITAPFAGYITKRYLDPGALVTTNNAILYTLMDLEEMKVIVNVLERDISLIAEGKEATVFVDAFPGHEFKGIVKRYSQALDLATRTMAVEIDIPNPTLKLKPGMFGKVTIIVEERLHVMTLPTAAILKDNEGFLVYTVVHDTARKVRVEPGIEQGERTEVRSGIDTAAVVIATGQQFVKVDGPVVIQ